MLRLAPLIEEGISLNRFLARKAPIVVTNGQDWRLGLKGKKIGLRGVLGVGKTEFGKEVGDVMKDGPVEYVFREEFVTEDSLSLFYTNIPKYAHQFQTLMMERCKWRYAVAEEAAKQGVLSVCDRLPEDNWIFHSQHVTAGNIILEQHNAYRSEYKAQLPYAADATIHFRATPEETLNRVHLRGRNSEKNMTVEYLDENDRAHLMFTFGMLGAGHKNISLYNWQDLEAIPSAEEVLRDCIARMDDPERYKYVYRARNGINWLSTATTQERTVAFETLCTRHELIMD